MRNVKMISEVFENIHLRHLNYWFKGHLYITSDDKIIWSPSSAPLHDCQSSLGIPFILGLSLGIAPNKIDVDFPKRKEINIDGLIRIGLRSLGKHKKILVLQTMNKDISFKGDRELIDKFRTFLPDLEKVSQNKETTFIYFYIDNTILEQLFEQTPEGDIVEVLREASSKFGAKTIGEFGLNMISKLSLELSAELGEKTVIKTQLTTGQKIAIVTMFLIATDQAYNLATYNFRKIPTYLYFDNRIKFDWCDENKLTYKEGVVNAELIIIDEKIIHGSTLDELKKQEAPKINGLARTHYSNNALTLTPIYLSV